MSRKQGKVVLEGNGPVPRHDELEPDQPTLWRIYIDYLNKDSIDR